MNMKNITYFLNKNYHFLTLSNFYIKYVKNKKTNSTKNKIILLRHDIDTDTKTAYEMFKIEKIQGKINFLFSSFYIRH